MNVSVSKNVLNVTIGETSLKLLTSAVVSVGNSDGGDADTLQGENGAYYLDRANHTGTQAISTIDGLQTALDYADANRLFKPVALTAATDFNSLTAEGRTVVPTNEIAAACTNRPSTTAGVLDVALVGSGVLQVYRVFEFDLAYERQRLSGGTWTAWVQMASKDMIDTAAANTLQSSKDYADSATKSAVKEVLLNLLAAAFSAGGFIGATGTLLISAGWRATDFVRVMSGKSYKIYAATAGGASHAWYDANQVFISVFGQNQAAGEVAYTAPANARFMRVSTSVATVASAYIKSDLYNVDVARQLIGEHMPQVEASKIDYQSTTVDLQLDAMIAKQNLILSNQNAMSSSLDLITDADNALFVNTSRFVKSSATPASFAVVDVTSRVSATQMTVSDASAFVVDGACVVFDNAANTYTSHGVTAISGSTISVSGALPSSPFKAQTMHDSTNGQHLSNFGYYGLADHIVGSVIKYAYKKDSLFFKFLPPITAAKTFNDPNIYDLTGTNILIPVTALNGAVGGGFVAGTTNLVKVCGMTESQNAGSRATTQYLSRHYAIVDGVAGRGMQITFDGQSSDGFIEIPVAARSAAYTSSADSQSYMTSGRARLEVLNGATVIFDQTYAVGEVNFAYINFTNGGIMTIRLTLADAVPSSIMLGGIFAYKKSAATSTSTLFQSGDVIAFLGDSWTQFPLASTVGETGQTRPDGSISTGAQYLSRRIKDKLAASGVNVTTLNMGFGGQTSAWGKNWVGKIFALNPKPTHCIICFYVNDNNSINTPSATAYDFDPVDMFLNKTVASGGLDGKIANSAAWKSNLLYIVNRLTASGIKPIILMPSQTASSSQSQSIRSLLLDNLATGFN